MPETGIKTRDANATRRALRRAARRVFAESGFDGASIREIARESDANSAMISYHFGGKQELFSDVLLGGIEALQAEIREEMERARSAGPAARIEAFVEALGGFAEREPWLLPLLSRELMDGGRHLEPHVGERFAGFFSLVREALEDGVRAGAFRPLDPHAAHISLVGSLVWFALTEPLRERWTALGRAPAPAPSWPDYVEHVQRLFLAGLSPRIDPPPPTGGGGPLSSKPGDRP